MRFVTYIFFIHSYSPRWAPIVVNSDSKLTPIQTMMCGAKKSSNQYQSEHKQ